MALKINDDIFARINAMSRGEYYIDNGNCHIIAKSVDRKQIIITCPFCIFLLSPKNRFSGLHPKIRMYKKDSNPYKNAKKFNIFIHHVDFLAIVSNIESHIVAKTASYYVNTNYNRLL